jgi:trigger factor
VKVSTERLPESQLVLQIEVEDERLEKAKQSAYKRLASKVKVPGFRPGKAPPAVLRNHIGEDIIVHEAIDRLMPEVYREALEQEDINPIDRAEYELVTEQPLVAKFTVPLRPSVDLGGYRDIRIEKEQVTVEPERVDESLEDLRHRYATFEPVDRPIQWGDAIRADVKATLDDGSTLVSEDDAEFQLLEERPIALPGFAEGLLGGVKGGETTFQAEVPQDWQNESQRGKTVTYTVNLKEFKQEVLPELDDDFARQVGEGFDSLEALRQRIETDLHTALENEATRRYQDQAVDALVEGATLEYAPVMIEREIDHLLEDQAAVQDHAKGKKNTRDDVERFLQRVGKTEAEVREEFRPIAETRIRRTLVLSQLSETEDIEVDDAQVDAEIERMAEGAGSQADELRRLFSTDAAKESIRRSLRTRNTLDRLVEITSGEVDMPEEAEASTPLATES